MALVFKIKYGDTLRRWVVCETLIVVEVLPTLQQVDAKIRELFHLAPTASIVITYVDRDNDLVTLAEDQDLLDACLEQRLNPLRLDVKIREELPKSSACPSTISAECPKDGNVDADLRVVRPPATADSRKPGLLQAVEPASVLWPNVHNALKKFLKALTRESGWEMYDGYQPHPASTENPTLNFPASHSHVVHADDSNSFPHRDRSGKGEWNRIFHRDVRCDGCGMSPIEGCRFISKKKSNYDLCSICFNLIGNETDYQRMEHPLHPPSHSFHSPSHAWKERKPRMGTKPRRPLFPHGPHSWQPGMQSGNFFPPGEMGTKPRRPLLAHGPHSWQPEYPVGMQSGNFFPPGEMGTKPRRLLFAHGPHSWQPEYPVGMESGNFFPPGEISDRLDARFVKDVTILDGTELAPGTKFTKIWRLTNIGTIPWPQNTQLVHIGGDMLSSVEVVNLKIPEGGVTCGNDVEASVDLVAPGNAGCYVSHWRLLSPSGQMFGHRLWVVIQVVPPLSRESVRGEEKSQEHKAGVFTSKERVQAPNSDIQKEREVSHPWKDGVIVECHNEKDEHICDLDKGESVRVEERNQEDRAAVLTSKERMQAPNSDIWKEREVSYPRKDGVILECHNGKDGHIFDLDKGADKAGIEVVEQGNTKERTDEAGVTAVAEDKGADKSGIKVAEQGNTKNCSTDEAGVTADAEDLLVDDKEQYEQHGSTMLSSELDGFSVMEKPVEIAEWDVLNLETTERKDHSTLCQQPGLQDKYIGSLKEQEVQLRLLESMGYTDRALNVDLLEKNNQSLELTVDDLILTAGWDNILTELQDMGFNDKSTNCRLLIKNKGSIKWVVKHLMQMEKDNAGQTGKATLTVA